MPEGVHPSVHTGEFLKAACLPKAAARPACAWRCTCSSEAPVKGGFNAEDLRFHVSSSARDGSMKYCPAGHFSPAELCLRAHLRESSAEHWTPPLPTFPWHASYPDCMLCVLCATGVQEGAAHRRGYVVSHHRARQQCHPAGLCVSPSRGAAWTLGISVSVCMRIQATTSQAGGAGVAKQVDVAAVKPLCIRGFIKCFLGFHTAS